MSNVLLEPIPGIPEWFHIKKSTYTIHHVNQHRENYHMAMFFGTEKPLDKSQHPFLRHTQQELIDAPLI